PWGTNPTSEEEEEGGEGGAGTTATGAATSTTPTPTPRGLRVSRLRVAVRGVTIRVSDSNLSGLYNLIAAAFEDTIKQHVAEQTEAAVRKSLGSLLQLVNEQVTERWDVLKGAAAAAAPAMVPNLGGEAGAGNGEGASSSGWGGQGGGSRDPGGPRRDSGHLRWAGGTRHAAGGDGSSHPSSEKVGAGAG
ncbi:unnamed protein product, partial [Discosporangium mesarthrocarpum]